MKGNGKKRKNFERNFRLCFVIAASFFVFCFSSLLHLSFSIFQLVPLMGVA